LDLAAFEAPPVDADVIVLAGDIAPGTRGLDWAARHFPHTPCVYVAGNHEFYGGAAPTILTKLRDHARRLGIHFLENAEVAIGGIRFLGSTLWTDFALTGDRARSIEVARSELNDYRRVRVAPRYRRLRPEDTWGWHDSSRAWLRSRLTVPGTKVVVTHHAPSPACLAPQELDQPLSAAFSSNLHDLIVDSAPALWIHGHTHRSGSFGLASTRVVSNQRGYPGEPDPGFNPSLVVGIAGDPLSA
jgi:hypothetical protein